MVQWSISDDAGNPRNRSPSWDPGLPRSHPAIWATKSVPAGQEVSEDEAHPTLGPVISAGHVVTDWPTDVMSNSKL